MAISPTLFVPHNPAHTKFRTGAIPTPRYKLAAAAPYQMRGPTPPQGPGVLPAFLEMWLNDQDGDCVTAEEAAAKAFWSVVCGLSETRITDACVLAFCNKYNVLNGAGLTEVMDAMISDGFHNDDGTVYKDGPYASVDYSNEGVLQNALNVGPVKLGMDSSALPSGAGSVQGWTAFGGTPQQFTNEDHSTGLWTYGPTAWLAQLIQKTFNVTVQLPSNAPPNGYIHYTWSTVGVVDHPWIMSTVGEAWVRNPTTVGQTPGPGPTPTPTPPQNVLTLPNGLGKGNYPLDNVGSTVLLAKDFPSGNFQVPYPSVQDTLVLSSQLPVGSIQIPGYGVMTTQQVYDIGSYALTLSKATVGALPPFLLAILQVICALPTSTLPPLLQTFKALLCGLVPPQVKGPCG